MSPLIHYAVTVATCFVDLRLAAIVRVVRNLIVAISEGCPVRSKMALVPVPSEYGWVLVALLFTIFTCDSFLLVHVLTRASLRDASAMCALKAHVCTVRWIASFA